MANKTFDQPWRVRHFESYARCPRQFYLRYIKQNPEDYRGEAAIKGIAYHKAFEEWLLGKWDGKSGFLEACSRAIAVAESEADEVTGIVTPVKWFTSRSEASREMAEKLTVWMESLRNHPVILQSEVILTEFNIRTLIRDKYSAATRGDALLKMHTNWGKIKAGDFIYLDFKTGAASQPSHQFFLNNNVQFDLTYVCFEKGEIEDAKGAWLPTKDVIGNSQVWFCWFSLSDLTRYKVKSTKNLKDKDLVDYMNWARVQHGYNPDTHELNMNGQTKAKEGIPPTEGRWLKNGKWKEGKPGTPPVSFKPGDMKGPGAYFTTRRRENLAAIEKTLGMTIAGARMNIFPQSAYKMGPCDNCRVRTPCALQKDPEIKDEKMLKEAQLLTATAEGGNNEF